MDSNNISREDSLNFCNTINLNEFNKIQPHGAVIVLNKNLDILFYSKNLPSLLNTTHEQLSKEKITDFLTTYDQSDVSNIQQYLLSNIHGYKKLLWSSNRTKTEIYTQVNPNKKNIILNIERINESCVQQEEDKDGLSNLVQIAIASLPDMSSCQSIGSLSRVATDVVKRITGYDSVMVYKFDPDDYSGVVIAQTSEPDMHQYVGLHFPPNDVPKSVIDSYILQPLRYIPSIIEEPNELVKCLAGEDDEPNIGTSPLRMVAPVHVKYLQNMNVSSSTSIAILYNGKVWGLIACHSKIEKYISINQRIILSFIAYSLSSIIHTLQYKKKFRAEQALLQLQSDLTSSFSKAESLLDGLESYHQEFMKIMNASGMAIYFQESINSFGSTPSASEILNILTWLKSKNKPVTYATRNLPEEFKEAISYKNKASGLLAIKLTEIENHYILFFRPEELETIEWAGNPEKVLSFNNESYSPRDSFERFIESRRNKSKIWTNSDISSANFIRSLTASRHLQDLLQTQALHDPLTGLYNRLYLDQRLSLELQRAIRSNESLSLLLIDLDYFKKINDNFGHQVGDVVLVEFAKLLTSNFRGYDYIYRYGGEEFIIILPNTDIEEASRKAESLRKACQALKISVKDKTLAPISVSIGGAAYPNHADDARSLIGKADEALYKAKNSGRNKIVISTEKIG